LRYLALILSTLLIFALNANSQTSLGFYFGTNKASLAGDAPDRSKFQSDFGITIGAILDIKVAEDISILFEPGFATNNTKLIYRPSGSEQYKDSLAININVFRLPVTLKMISYNKRWQFLGGLGFSYPIKAVTVDQGGQETDLSSQITDFNVTALFGIGYRIPIKTSNLSINLRYNQGLVNIANSGDEQSAIPRVKSNIVQFVLAWQFPLGQTNER